MRLKADSKRDRRAATGPGRLLSMLRYVVGLSLAMPTVSSFRSLNLIAQSQILDCSRDSLPPGDRPQYFPTPTFGIGGAFTASRYSCYLRAMQETPLPKSITEDITQVYRLTVIPAWRPPLIVRLAVRNDGTGMLVEKAARSQKDAAALTLDRSEDVPRPETTEFLELVKKADFWSMPTVYVYSKDPRVIVKVMDGVEWVLEGGQDARYHVVTRTSPAAGPYMDLISYLFKNLGKLELPPPPPIPRKRRRR